MLAFFSYVDLPMQIPNIMYYLLFFFMGYAMYSYRERLMNHINVKHVVVAWAFFVILYIGLSYVRNYGIVNLEEGNMLEIVKKGCRMGYTIVGMMAFYLTSVYVVSRVKISPWWIKIGAMCFGVYIFQQFILQSLYYHTSLSVLVVPLLLPWLAFAVTLFGSVLLTWLVRKTTLGRRIL